MSEGDSCSAMSSTFPAVYVFFHSDRKEETFRRVGDAAESATLGF